MTIARPSPISPDVAFVPLPAYLPTTTHCSLSTCHAHYVTIDSTLESPTSPGAGYIQRTRFASETPVAPGFRKESYGSFLDELIKAPVGRRIFSLNFRNVFAFRYILSLSLLTAVLRYKNQLHRMPAITYTCCMHKRLGLFSLVR